METQKGRKLEGQKEKKDKDRKLEIYGKKEIMEDVMLKGKNAERIERKKMERQRGKKYIKIDR